MGDNTWEWEVTYRAEFWLPVEELQHPGDLESYAHKVLAHIKLPTYEILQEIEGTIATLTVVNDERKDARFVDPDAES